MNKKGISVTFNGLILTFFMVAFVFSIYSGFKEAGSDKIEYIEQSIHDQTNISLPKKGLAIALFPQTLNSLTPALRNDWLPPKGEYTFILEDLPIIDGTDFIFIVPFMLLGMFLLKKWEEDNLLKAILVKALVFIGIFVITFISWKIIMYNLYLWSGSVMGLSKVFLLEFRQLMLGAIENITVPMLILSILGSLGIVNSLKKDN